MERFTENTKINIYVYNYKILIQYRLMQHEAVSTEMYIFAHWRRMQA